MKVLKERDETAIVVPWKDAVPPAEMPAKEAKLKRST
jgi:hypothetical protein